MYVTYANILTNIHEYVWRFYFKWIISKNSHISFVLLCFLWVLTLNKLILWIFSRSVCSSFSFFWVLVSCTFSLCFLQNSKIRSKISCFSYLLHFVDLAGRLSWTCCKIGPWTVLSCDFLVFRVFSHCYYCVFVSLVNKNIFLFWMHF